MASSPRVRKRSRVRRERHDRYRSGCGGAQAVEHYEMARYGALIAWAGQLGMSEAAALLNQTLQEETKAERLLTQIAKRKADQTAATKMAA